MTTYLPVFISLGVCLMGIVIFMVQMYVEKQYLFLNEMLYGESYNSVAEFALYYKNNYASSVWCVTRLDNNKICHFRNLYYFPELKGHILFILNEHSVISGIRSRTELKSINLSSVQNLTTANLKLIAIKSFENVNLTQGTIIVLNKKTFIMQRFKPDNIMHVIHDDLLPLYGTFHEMCQGDIDQCIYSYHLTFMDNFEEGPFLEWYKIFSKFEPLLLTNFKKALCMRESVIGLSNESVWFQYGYKNVHGPVSNTHFNGLKLRQFSQFVKHKLKIESGYNLSSSEGESAVFLNRKINRRILNYKILEENIQKIYLQLTNQTLKVLSLDLSTNDSMKIVHLLQKTKLLIGMHGSAMMLAVFLPENSYIIELFPFGIQPDFVSPLKALCSLPNVSFKYIEWVNKNEANSITHPESHPLLGGIQHLPMNEQLTIQSTKLVPPVECCHNSLYLYRMFQDTIVDRSFFNLLQQVVNDSIMTREEDMLKDSYNVTYSKFYFPPPVFNLTCECVNGFLKLSWKFPFSRTGVKFSVATSSGKTLETESLQLSIEDVRCKYIKGKPTAAHQAMYDLSVWVKALDDGQESLDSYLQCSKL